jgi:hypothetical protein
MVNYPNGIDNDLTLPPLDGYQAPFGNPTVEDLRQAIFAIETELGILPAGAYSTVRTRLDILELRGTGSLPVPTGTNTVLTWTGSTLAWDAVSDVANPFYIGNSGVSIQDGYGDPNVDGYVAVPGSLFLREDANGGLNVYSFGQDGYWGLIGTEPTPPPIISLGTAATFGVLGASTVTNTGGTNIGGDLGLSPGTSITGFPPGAFTGTEHAADATAAAAQLAATAAFVEGNALLGGIVISGDLGGQTLTSGVYKSASTIGITGTLTLDGQNNPNAYWVFQIGSALTTASSAVVALINGASAANVFWLIGSSATLGTGTTFNGTIIAQASITANTSTNITGRLLAQTAAVTLDDNQITLPSSGGGGGFTAGGDLTGSSTNQTVVGIQAVAISATAPSTGQVLTATSSTAANWQTPSGGSGGGNVVVFQPGGTPASNVYTDWPSAYAALIAIQGFRILEIDASFNSGTATVPPGNYIFGTNTRFVGPPGLQLGQTTLLFSEGSIVDMICDVQDLFIGSSNNATPIVTLSESIQIHTENVEWTTDYIFFSLGSGASVNLIAKDSVFFSGGVALFSLNNATLNASLDNSTFINNCNIPALTATSPTISFTLFNNSQVESGSITGTGSTISASADDSSAIGMQAGYSGSISTTLLSQATQVNYSAATPANWSGSAPTNDNNAIDRLAAAFNAQFGPVP